jgi:DNA-directed RNA polymerase subunit RPC12/RpoP
MNSNSSTHERYGKLFLDKACKVCGKVNAYKIGKRYMHIECLGGFRALLKEKSKKSKHAKQVLPASSEWIAIIRDSKPNSIPTYLCVGDFGITLTHSEREASRWVDSVTAWKFAEMASIQFSMAFKAFNLSKK